MSPSRSSLPPIAGPGAPNGSPGMTLIEVVAVLLLLGIMTFVATSRMTSGTADLMATVDGVSSRLRLVQTIAMNSSQGVWGIRFEQAGQTYHMFHCRDATDCDMDRDALPLPGADADSNKRVAVSESGAIQLLTNDNVAYDGFGRPCRITGTQAVLVADPITVSFGDGAGNTHDIQITPQTGYIP